MPVTGLEPVLCHHKQILSLPRLPFRHTGIPRSAQTGISCTGSATEYYVTIKQHSFQAFLSIFRLKFKIPVKIKAIKGGKIVFRCFRTADHFHTFILL